MKRLLGLFALAMLAGMPAMAAQESSGCGLGSIVFKGQKGMGPNILAATTNGTAGNQTFGITSGTSNCNADNVVKRDVEQQMFVAANLENLSQEMAQGQGQYLHALAGLMGCTPAVHGEFARMSQEKYGVLFPTADAQPVAVLTGLKGEMAQQPALAASCSRIS